MTEINNRLRTMFPGMYRDAQVYLVNKALGHIGITPTTADNAAIAQGMIPPSLRPPTDNVHVIKAAHDAMAANLFAPFFNIKGWV